jgi:hypothetical protein
MVDPNTNGDEPRLVLTGGGSGARVVLAEVDAPGSLHYLLEAEGFQVVGCAGDDEELGRVLGQDLRPDVVVLDADIVATSSLVARELAPEAHLIAIWPDAVQPPPGGERISPRQVYEELGPAIRRHMDRRSVAVPVIALPATEPVMASVAAGVGVASGMRSPRAEGSESSGVFTRAASRMSVLSVTLITAILLTMGVSFALGGFRSGPSVGPPRLVVPGSYDVGGVTGTADPFTGRVPSGTGNDPSGNGPSNNGGGGPNDHHNAAGSFSGVVTTGGGDGGGPSGGQTGDPGTGQGDPGTGQGDQSSGQGDQGGGGQGDQGGGGQGGGGQGGGGQGDQGGGGQGDQGGGGQGDQGGDSQGEDDQGGTQGDQDGDDQGENNQGDQGSQGGQGPHGDGHGAHSDQGQSDQGQN